MVVPPKGQMPAKWAIVPFYAVGALSFFLVCLLCLRAAADFPGHYFSPKILAITHLAVLGWATMIIMGASNQLIPVITEQKLYSERLPVIILFLLAFGTGLLVYCFWNFLLNWVAYTGGACIFTALILHATNVYQTAKNAKENIVNNLIVIAHVWLLFTALLGLTLIINLRFPLLALDHLQYLNVHAGIGMAGWFLQLIMGVSARLVPMFLLSRKEEPKWLQGTYYCLNIGLVVLLVNGMLMQSSWLQLLSVGLIAMSVGFYGKYIYSCYKSALRKKLDAGLRQTFVALFLLVVPFILLLIAVLVQGSPPPSLVTALGYSFFGGFVSILIMAQTFKTLPFIVWMHLSDAAKLPNAMPKNLYKEQWVRGQLFLYLPGYLTFLAGILFQQPYLLYIGASLMTVAAAWYFVHVLLIISKLKQHA